MTLYAVSTVTPAAYSSTSFILYLIDPPPSPSPGGSGSVFPGAHFINSSYYVKVMDSVLPGVDTIVQLSLAAGVDTSMSVVYRIQPVFGTLYQWFRINPSTGVITTVAMLPRGGDGGSTNYTLTVAACSAHYTSPPLAVVMVTICVTSDYKYIPSPFFDLPLYEFNLRDDVTVPTTFGSLQVSNIYTLYFHCFCDYFMFVTFYVESNIF